jgi:Zn-dependent protease with chaperone function
MGHLISILAALASLACADLELLSGWRLPWAVPALMAAPYLLSAAERRAGLRGNFRQALFLARLGVVAPVLLYATALVVCGWSASLEGWLGVRISILEWPRLELLPALLPFVAYSLASIDAVARVQGEGGRLTAIIRSFQMRMFFATLVPIVIYLAASALLGRNESLRVHVEEVELLGAGFTAVIMVCFVFFLPRLLQQTWDTEPLPVGPERALLEELASQAGFRCKEILLWRTGGLIPNAAVVGVTAGTRRVFFSDALLERLSPRQLVAVYAHEIGHVRGGHVMLFATWALSFFAGIDLFSNQLGGGSENLATLFFGVGLVLWWFGFGWLSRRAELEADLYSLEILGEGASLREALERVSPDRGQRAGWRHFSPEQRTRFLSASAADPRVGRRLRSRLRLARWLGALCLSVIMTLQGAGLVDNYAEDQARASLLLGRFASAEREIAQVPEPNGDLAQLIALAQGGFPTDFRNRRSAARACRERAEALDAAGAPELAQPWWLLFQLTGEPGRAGAGPIQ